MNLFNDDYENEILLSGYLDFLILSSGLGYLQHSINVLIYEVTIQPCWIGNLTINLKREKNSKMSCKQNCF